MEQEKSITTVYEAENKMLNIDKWPEEAQMRHLLRMKWHEVKKWWLLFEERRWKKMPATGKRKDNVK